MHISETFVYNQSMKLSQFEAFFLGAKRPKGPRIDLPEERTYLVNQGGIIGWLREAAFKVFGYVPRDVLTWARELRPALVHAHFGPDGAVALPISQCLKLPMIVSFHGTDATTKDEYALRSFVTHRLYIMRRRKLRRAVTQVVVQSEFIKRKVIDQHGFPQAKISLIRHGIDLRHFTQTKEATEWGHILFVGRLIPLKGLHFLIEAVSRVKRRYPDAWLTVIGDGPMRSDYEATAARKLQGHFVFLGARPQTMVKEYLERAYIFSMPSVTMPSGQAESLGLVFLEAQAMRVPVVSFRSGGIPEVVMHGETGLLAQEGDVEELTRHLVTLLENPEQRKRMGRAGRARVERFFDLKKQNAELEELYLRVLADKDE